MPRIAVDNIEPDTTPKIVQPEVLDHSAIIDKSDPNGTDKLIKAKSTNTIFSAFYAFPDNVRFQGEDDDENIILLMRAHPITNVKWIIIAFLLLIIPAMLFPLLGTAMLPIGGGGSGLAFVLLWISAVFTYSFINFLYWYFNVYIITNERIIDIDWYSIIFHNTDATRISKIQEVSSFHSGVFASIFDYGHVRVQTAGEQQNFEFDNLPHPDLVSKKIQEIMELEEKEREKNPDS
ncbi:PH domain-containing protein [Candidatus Microgenomates bacterium]|nr:PH domain-containing protein [Candidatus Microgenomates bacterium]